MGNCFAVGIKLNDSNIPEEKAEAEQGYFDHPAPPVAKNREYDPPETAITSATMTPFSETPDTMEAEEQMVNKYLMMQSRLMIGDEAGSSSSSPSKQEKKLVDPKIVALLQFFRQLYLRRKELFGKIIPVHGEELIELFQKMGQAPEKIEQAQVRLFKKRSFSAGTSRGLDMVDDDLKMKRFKVKNLDAGNAPSPAGGGSGGKGGGGGGSSDGDTKTGGTK